MNTHRWINLPGLSRSGSDDGDGGGENDSDKMTIIKMTVMIMTIMNYDIPGEGEDTQ